MPSRTHWVQKISALPLLCLIVKELDCSVVEGACSETWTQAGGFCYKKLDTAMPNSTVAGLAKCAEENGVFPILRSGSDFEAFLALVPKLNCSTPFRVPLALMKSLTNGHFYWTDSGERSTLNESYWGDGQRMTSVERCVAISTLDNDYRLHDYDCALPTNVVCQRGFREETQTEIPCYELRRCIFEHGTHFTDGDIFACNSTTGVRQVGPSLRVGFAANVFHDGITEPLYSFRLPASLVKRASSSESPLETVLATNSTQIAYLTSKGYTLTKITGFLPNVSTTQDIELRYLYWKDMPPVDSVLAMDSEKKQYEAQGVWKLVDTVYVFAVQSNEKCSIAIDCQWSQWQEWSSCSQSCDGGYRSRTRSITLPASGGGICPGNDTEIDNTPCSEECARDCEWNTWNPWSTCSVTCANGTMWRNRTVKAYSRGRGKNCSLADNNENGICTLSPCPIDCVWTEWSPWGLWPATCGPPVLRYRNRSKIDAKYGGKQCLPVGAWVDSQIKGLPPCPPPNDTYVDPVSPSWRVAIQAMQSLGSSAVIACCSASFLLAVAFRSFSAETVLHMGQELSLIAAYALITVCGFRGQAKGINEHLCIPTAISLHYLFIVNFMFMTFEAVQSYSVLTNVISGGGFMTRKTSYVLALVTPLAVVLPTALLCEEDYISKNSCWVNLAEAAVAFFVVGPLIVCCSAVVILVEASGVEDYYPPLPFTDLKLEESANICRAGLMIKGPLAMIAYIFGALAIFNQAPWMYTCAMPLNISLGVTIVMFHISANEKVLLFVREKVLNRFKCLRRENQQMQTAEVLFEIKRAHYQAAKERRMAQKRHVIKQKVGAKFFLADHDSTAEP